MLDHNKSTTLDQSKRLAALARRQHDSLGFLLIRCGQLWNERGIAQVNREAGAPVLREAHTKLLPHLQAPGGVRITELAKTLGVTKQAVQPLIAELEEAKVVRVEADPDDARARRVFLTRHGVDAMLHGTGVLEAIEAGVREQLGKADTEKLKRLLQQLLETLVRREPPL